MVETCNESIVRANGVIMAENRAKKFRQKTYCLLKGGLSGGWHQRWGMFVNGGMVFMVVTK
jgi:hypothetical protein